MWDFSEDPSTVSEVRSVQTNLLLRQLPPADRTLMEPHFQFKSVRAGTTLVEIGEPLDAIYFPLDAVISVEQTAGLEVATVGREGMFGWSAMTDCHRSPFRAVLRGPDGFLLKLPLEIAHLAIAASAHLRATVYQYLVVIAIHMSETISSQGLHRVDTRLARWLLVRHDRLGGDEIRAKHSEIADNLGVRRASITDCLHILEGEGYIHSRRGRIVIRDRCSLENLAGQCYGSAEAHYRSSFASFGKCLHENLSPAVNRRLTIPRPAEAMGAM